MKGTGKIKKYEVALFLKAATASDYVRIKKATDLKLSFNAKTETYDYIADENPTTELEQYKPEITGLPLTMYRDEPDFAMIWDFAYNLKTGGNSTADILLVYKFDEEAEATGKFKAWHCGATVIVKTLDAVAGKLEFDLRMRGTVERGTVSDTNGKPVFEKAA